MIFEHGQRCFHTVRGSDVVRDGMFLELYEHGSDAVVLEAFYADADGSLTVSCHGGVLPIEVMEWFLTQARQSLPPAARTD